MEILLGLHVCAHKLPINKDDGLWVGGIALGAPAHTQAGQIGSKFILTQPGFHCPSWSRHRKQRKWAHDNKDGRNQAGGITLKASTITGPPDRGKICTTNWSGQASKNPKPALARSTKKIDKIMDPGPAAQRSGRPPTHRSSRSIQNLF